MNSDLAYLLVLDAIRVPHSKAFCQQENVEFYLLYNNTDWSPQLQNSPICIPFSPDDATHNIWCKEQQWASSGVVFEYENHAERERALSLLSRNITVKGEDERMLFLRFYSPATLIEVAAYPEKKPIDYLLGNALSVHLSPLLWAQHSHKRIEKSAPSTFIESYLFPTSLIENLMQ